MVPIQKRSAAIVPFTPPAPGNNPLDAAPPDPGSALVNRIIHPRNLEIEARRQQARILTKKEIVAYQKQLNILNAQLDEAGYEELNVAARLAFDRYQDAVTELNGNPTEERCQELQIVIRQREKRLAELKPQIQAINPLLKKREEIITILRDHRYAIDRKRLHDVLRKEMAAECWDYAEMMIEAWARLGFKFEYFDKKKKKTIVHKVSFSEIDVTPDAIWYKINSTVKAIFGYRSALPYRVSVRDLVSPETLEDLEAATQRQVTAAKTKHNGYWIIVHRLQTRDGILEYITLSQLLKSYPHEQRELMPIPIGVGEGRQVSWINVAEIPHALIAGSTGNGKSNLTKAWLCTLIQKQSPDELRLVLVDLKEGAEFAQFADIPHLLVPIVKSPEAAVECLTQIEALRAERMKTIAKAGCQNILQFNRRFPDKKMPRIIVFVDEFARMKTRGRDVNGLADKMSEEITALGRAAGVHLFPATQTPYVNILPGQTKANMALRIAFMLPDSENSRSIIGNGEAAQLPPVVGRAIAVVGSSRWQIQTPHCQDSDVAYALEIARKFDAPEPLELPDGVRVQKFDEKQLLDICINDLNGNLGTKPIYQYASTFVTVSRGEVDKLVKDIIKRGGAEWNGKTYKVRKVGNGRELFTEDKSADSPESPNLQHAPIAQTQPGTLPEDSEDE